MNKLGSNIYVIPKETSFIDKSRIPSRRPSQIHNALLQDSELANTLKKELANMKEKYELSLEQIKELKMKESSNPVNFEEILKENKNKYEEKIKAYTEKIDLLEKKNITLSESIQSLRSNINDSKMNEEIAIKKLKENEKKLSTEISNILKEYQRKLDMEQKQFIDKEKLITQQFVGKLNILQKENDQLKSLIQASKNDKEIEVLEKKIIENEKAHQAQVTQLKDDLRKINIEYQQKLNELRVAESNIVKNEKLYSTAKVDLKKQTEEIEKFYKEKEFLSSQLRIKEVAIANLQNNFDNLLTEQMLKDEENATMNEEIKKYQTSIESLKNEILILERDLQDRANKDFTDSIININDKEKINEQKNLLLQKEQELRDAKLQIEKSREKYLKSDEQLNKMNIELGESKNIISTLQNELQNISVYNRQLISQNEEFAISTSNYIDEIAQKQNEINQLKLKLQDSNTSNRTEIINKIYVLEDKITQLTSINVKSELDIQNKIREINLLKTRLQTQNQLENELNTYKLKARSNNEIVEDLQNRLDILKRDNESLQIQTNQLLENRYISERDKNEILSKYQLVLADSNSLKMANDSLTQQNVVLTNSVTQLYNQINYVNFAVNEKQQIIDYLEELHKNIQRQYTIVNNEAIKERDIQRNEEDIMQKLQNFAEVIYTSFDAYIMIADSHVVNGNLFLSKYVEPFLKLVKGLENHDDLIVNFQVEKGGVMNSIKNIISKLLTHIRGNKSNVREHSFYEQTTKAYAHNYVTQYNSLVSVLTVFKENPIKYPKFDEVKKAHATLFSKINTFTENLQGYLKKVTSSVSINAINIIIEHNKRLGIAIQRINDLMGLNISLMEHYEIIIPSIIKSFNELDNLRTRNVVIDYNTLIQFCSPSINNIGKLGCELLMYIKNLCIEIEDKGYGNNRNHLKLDRDILILAHEYLGNLLSNELMNRSSPLSYLYDLRIIFARNLINNIQRYPKMDTFILTRDPIDSLELEVIWNTFSPPSEKNSNMRSLMLNKQVVYFDDEAKVLMFNNLQNMQTIHHRDLLFFFLATILERIIIKFEDYSYRKMYVQHIDTKGELYQLATEIKEYFSDYPIDILMTEIDFTMFIKFREFIDIYVKNICETYSIADNALERTIQTDNKNILPFITKATENNYKPRGYLDGPKEAVYKIVNKSREAASSIAKKIKNTFQNLPTPNLSTLYYEWKEKGRKVVNKAVNISKTIGSKAKEAFVKVKNWFTNMFCKRRLIKGDRNVIPKINVVDYKPFDKFDQDDISKAMLIFEEVEEEDYHINVMPQEELEKRVSVGLNYEKDEYVEPLDIDESEKYIVPSKLKERVTVKPPKQIPIEFGPTIEITPADFSKEYYKNIKIEYIPSRFNTVKETRVRPNEIINPIIPTGTPNYNSGIDLDSALNYPQIAFAA